MRGIRKPYSKCGAACRRSAFHRFSLKDMLSRETACSCPAGGFSLPQMKKKIHKSATMQVGFMRIIKPCFPTHKTSFHFIPFLFRAREFLCKRLKKGAACLVQQAVPFLSFYTRTECTGVTSALNFYSGALPSTRGAFFGPPLFLRPNTRGYTFFSRRRAWPENWYGRAQTL